MKQINTFKKLLLVTVLCAASAVNAQIHPLAFGTVGTGTVTNWYKDYVGVRLAVTAPAVIAGDKQNIAATIGTGSGDWPNIRDTSLINIPVVMPAVTDSYGVTPFPAGSMTGMICVMWRGPLYTPVYFSTKALAAQNAGALAVVFINEYPGQGPISPGYTSGLITIPVYMIGNLDGIAISNQYNALPAGSVKMTITHWGQGLKNDLGFVPLGTAGWHNYAIPSNQLFAGANPFAYMGSAGAFVANFGSSDAKNVKVTDTLWYTPNSGGGATVVHADVSPTLATFNGLAHTPVDATNDSIWALLAPTEFNFAPTGTGTGRFDFTYTIVSDTADQFAGDNSKTYSFYTSDSVYSKGRYDFVNKVPLTSIYEGVTVTTGATDFLWGPMYYVAKGGAAISSLQFSLSQTATGPISVSSMNLYVFKWVDGDPTVLTGNVPDSLVANGELQLVSTGLYNFSATDTSEMIFKVMMGDPTTAVPGAPILLSDNSWYYVAAEVPANFFLGLDGLSDAYPRVYSRFHHGNGIEYPEVLWAGDYNSGGNPLTSSYGTGEELIPFTGVSFIRSIDSFNYNNTKGMVPAIALIVNNNPDTTTVIDHTGVKNVSTTFTELTISPNPASDHLNVTLQLDQEAPTVTYTIIDGLARVASKEVHNNVKSETYTIPTAKMAAGNYYLVINANKQVMTKKFVIIK